METEFNLKADGERTHMDWVADVRVAGPIGSMGQRVFQPIVNQQVGNVLDALEAQVAEAKDGSEGATPSTEAQLLSAPRTSAPSRSASASCS